MTDIDVDNEHLLAHICTHFYLLLARRGTPKEAEHDEHFQNYKNEALRRMKQYTHPTKEADNER